MTASPSSLSLPRDRTRLVLHNDSEDVLYSNQEAYELLAYTGDTWEFIYRRKEPLGEPDSVEVEPGETHEWTMRADNTDLKSPLGPTPRVGPQEFAFRFPPGTYAFGFRIKTREVDHVRPLDMYATRFTVTGELPLVPSSGLESHCRRDSTHVVRTRGWQPDRYDDEGRVSLLLARVSSPRRTATLSLFDLYNPMYMQVPSRGSPWIDNPDIVPLLRDGFAVTKASAEQIRIETKGSTNPPFGVTEPFSVTYGGRSYRVTAEEGWGDGGLL